MKVDGDEVAKVGKNVTCSICWINLSEKAIRLDISPFICVALLVIDILDIVIWTKAISYLTR